MVCAERPILLMIGESEQKMRRAYWEMVTKCGDKWINGIIHGRTESVIIG